MMKDEVKRRRNGVRKEGRRERSMREEKRAAEVWLFWAEFFLLLGRVGLTSLPEEGKTSAKRNSIESEWNWHCHCHWHSGGFALCWV